MAPGQWRYIWTQTVSSIDTLRQSNMEMHRCHLMMSIPYPWIGSLFSFIVTSVFLTSHHLHDMHFSKKANVLSSYEWFCPFIECGGQYCTHNNEWSLINYYTITKVKCFSGCLLDQYLPKTPKKQWMLSIFVILSSPA